MDTLTYYKNIYADIYFNIAQIYKLKGDLANSVLNYNDALKLDNSSSKIKKELAAVLSDIGFRNYNEGKIYNAISYLAQSLKLFSEDDNAYNNLGVAYYGQGKFDEAIDQYQKSIKQNSKNVNAWNNIGMVSEKKVNIAGGKTYYKKACELGMQSTCNLLKD